MILVLDCETTGLPKNYQSPVTDLDNWPRAVQIAWGTYENDGTLIEFYNDLVWSLDFSIPPEATAKHGITDKMCAEKGKPIGSILEPLIWCMEQSDFIVAHNIDFDASVLGAEFLRAAMRNPFSGARLICTMKESTEFCAIPSRLGGYKWPRLSELFQTLFPGDEILKEHDAANDVATCARCFFELVERKVISIEKPELKPFASPSSRIKVLAILRQNSEVARQKKSEMLKAITESEAYKSLDAQLKENQEAEKTLESEIKAEALACYKLDQNKKPGLGWQIKNFENGKVTIPDMTKALDYCVNNLRPALALDVKVFESFAKSGKLPKEIVTVEDDPRVQIDSDLSKFL